MARQNGFGRRTCEVVVMNPSQDISSASSRKPCRQPARAKTRASTGLGRSNNNALLSRAKLSSLLLPQPHSRSTLSSNSTPKSHTTRKPSLKKRRAAWSLLERYHPVSVRDRELAKLRQLQKRNKMSTDSKTPAPGGRSSSREPLTATSDVKGVWPMAGSDSDRSKSVASEADSVFSASTRPTNETTPEILDGESKASAVQHWATAQSPGTVAADELARRLSAAAAGQQKHTITPAATADGAPSAIPQAGAAPLMTSAIPSKAPLMTSAVPPKSPSATTNPSPKIPVASPTSTPKEETSQKTIIKIKLKRSLVSEPREKSVKKYTSKKARKDSPDPYNLPDDGESDTCPTNQLKPSKKKEKRQSKKLLSSAPVDNDTIDEPTKKQKLTKEQRRAQKKLKTAPVPSPTTSTFSATTTTTDNGSDSEYLPKSKPTTKKRKSPFLPAEKKEPATKKPKTKATPPSPSPSSSPLSTSKSTTPASSAPSTSDRPAPQQYYQQRAAEILRSPLDYDDCVRDDTRPGKAQRIKRAFRRFRRDQGEPVSTMIGGARNPPDPETDRTGEKWGAPYQRGEGDGIIVGWNMKKARRIWGGQVNEGASEYAPKRQ